MFNEKSALVRIWVRRITDGENVIEDIPNLSNLREVVMAGLSVN